MKILKKINFSPSNDLLVLAGDLIGRGPNSLEVMEWVLENSSCVNAVLGNHDIHALSLISECRKPNRGDNLNTILQSNSRFIIADWLRKRPIMIDFPSLNALVVHAGIWPGFSLQDAILNNKLVCSQLSGSQWTESIEKLFGNEPLNWNKCGSEIEKIRFIINSSTRMRFVEKQSFDLDFVEKRLPGLQSNHLIPWMNAPNRIHIERQIIFGHWAALDGTYRTSKIHGIDTGYVWDGSLTALRLDDRKTFTVKNEEC